MSGAKIPSGAATGYHEEGSSHERLDAYHHALDFLRIAGQITPRLPGAKGQLGDQLARAAESILLRIAEGASLPRGGADQKGHFRAARALAGEASAILDVCRLRGRIRDTELTLGREILVKIAQTTTGLCR